MVTNFMAKLRQNYIPDYVATSCKNFVNFCLVTPEIMELICVPIGTCILAKIDLHICIRRAAIQKHRGALER